jgi:hypothetical protein
MFDSHYSLLWSAPLDVTFEPVTHDHRRVFPISRPLGTRTLRRVAVIAGITLIIRVAIAVAIYFGAFVILILSPMMSAAHERAIIGSGHHGLELIPAD